ncbi:MAG: bifunctional adenosylcobinamide kinase/adenosylcobinamide-phosphate guanylyltransferase [Endomicrobiales bacterium]|nr:bifunctional adenosylcobinamide kinase/adenosylcobinamide-phosphate guanylyltransferase [Endomicrobiales bacterium]
MDLAMILITGGVKSGKSTLALEIANKTKGRKLFVATAVPFDKEMSAKIERHRKERGSGFEVKEEPTEIAAVIRENDADAVVVDCVTVWVGNIMHGAKDAKRYFRDFIGSLKGNEIIVTNEVGMGVMPDNEMAREYAGLLGKINKELANKADEVYLTVSGLKMRIK